MKPECGKCIKQSPSDTRPEPDCANCKKDSPAQILPIDDQKS